MRPRPVRGVLTSSPNNKGNIPGPEEKRMEEVVTKVEEK